MYRIVLALGAIVIVTATTPCVDAAPQAAPVFAPPPSPPPPKLRSPPVPNPDTIKFRAVMISGDVTDDDYPASAIRNEEEGTVFITFRINETGRVDQCSADGATPSLQEVSCRIVTERFTYRPARDVRGNALPQWNTQRITWRIPPQMQASIVMPIAFVPIDKGMGFALAYKVSAQGRISDCRALALSEEFSRQGEDVCAAFAARTKAPVKKDQKGRPMAYSDSKLVAVAVEFIEEERPPNP
jgi:TonB family protein